MLSPTIQERGEMIREALATLKELLSDQAQEAPSFLSWLTERYGENWIVSQRSIKTLINRYGLDVHRLSSREYQDEKAKYEAETGLPANGFYHLKVAP